MHMSEWLPTAQIETAAAEGKTLQELYLPSLYSGILKSDWELSRERLCAADVALARRRRSQERSDRDRDRDRGVRDHERRHDRKRCGHSRKNENRLRRLASASRLSV